LVCWKFVTSSEYPIVIGAKFEARFRFLQERSRKETKSYLEFYKDYSFFLKEGIVTSTEKLEKEEIAKLLRFSFLFSTHVCASVSRPKCARRWVEG
jgi:HSP90 family molecular chaperone